VPYAAFLSAWRSGDANVYDRAMRAAWYFTDVAIDHAAKQVRMHGYPPHAFAVPMSRVLGTIAAWLETGDSYLLETAEAVVETSHRVHRNSWPRLAVGRDASFLRGAVMLYRYTGENYFLRIAASGVEHVVVSQREDGSFGDQGGGSGLHQYGSYIAKPWMGLIATSPVIDYLELGCADPDGRIFACVKRFADWLMAELFERLGSVGWTYQHAYNGVNEALNYSTGDAMTLKHPQSGMWHVEYLARCLMFCTSVPGFKYITRLFGSS
jgi:hypothetical protein